MKLGEYIEKMGLGRKDYSVYKYEDHRYEDATTANANQFSCGPCLFGWRSQESELDNLIGKSVVSVQFFPGDPLLTEDLGEHYITILV